MKTSKSISNTFSNRSTGLIPTLAFELVPALAVQIRSNSKKTNEEDEIQEGLSNIGGFGDF